MVAKIEVISAIEECKIIDTDFVVDCWKTEHVIQRDISYMFFGIMLMLKPREDIDFDAMTELGFLNDISYELESLK